MTTPKLIVSHLHDLPPLWDGRKVEWQGWSTEPPWAEFHFPPETCSACGLSAGASANLGVVVPLPGEMADVYKPRRLPSGRTYETRRTEEARPLLALSASRCQHCEHDVVHDMRTDEWWDLDPSDYGGDGSTDPRLL